MKRLIFYADGSLDPKDFPPYIDAVPVSGYPKDVVAEAIRPWLLAVAFLSGAFAAEVVRRAHA